MKKVVYNACYGGFSLSRKAIERLAELGNPEAIQMIEEGLPDSESLFLYDTPRHDDLLVQVVEELDEEASGQYSCLVVHELSGEQYNIKEYDGYESVEEPETKTWTSI